MDRPDPPARPARPDGPPGPNPSPILPAEPEAPKRAPVQCVECGEDFIPNPAEHPIGVAIILSFACDHCGREHPFALLSKRGAELRARLSAAVGYDPLAHDPPAKPRDTRPLAKALRREWRRLDPRTDHTLLTG